MPIVTGLATGINTRASQSALYTLSKGRLTSLSAAFQSGINGNNNTFAQVGLQFEGGPNAFIKIPLAEGYVSHNVGISWTGNIELPENTGIFLNIQSEFANQVAFIATTEV